MRHLLIILALAFPVGLIAGVLLTRQPSADENQARVCRAILPAIAGDDAIVTPLRARRGTRPASVRIEYLVEAPGATARSRQIQCEFAGEGLASGATDLVGVVTERGHMSDASLFFLRRYWLERAESALEAPQAPATAPFLGHVSPGAGYAIQQAVAAAPIVAVTGLMATAYALVYGLVGRIILAFGEFAALGAAGVALGVAMAQFAGFAATAALIAIGFIMAAWVTASWGAAAAKLVLAPVLGQPGQHVLIATVGLALAMSEGIRLSQGHYARWLSPVWNEPLLVAQAPGFAVTATPVMFAVASAALAAALALILFMRRARYGRAWRACSDDALAAALCGVDPGRTVLIACALGCGVAGLSGFLLTLQIGGMGYAGGAVFGLKALVGAVLGGVGSVGGALIGGLIVGALEGLWSATMPIEWRDVAVFSLLSLILIFRPGGLFGEGRESEKQMGRTP
ncbi:MAG: branched-chain amino acid ABC transporter permease [Beijerinckiaceae bacterium]